MNRRVAIVAAVVVTVVSGGVVAGAAAATEIPQCGPVLEFGPDGSEIPDVSAGARCDGGPEVVVDVDATSGVDSRRIDVIPTVDVDGDGDTERAVSATAFAERESGLTRIGLAHGVDWDGDGDQEEGGPTVYADCSDPSSWGLTMTATCTLLGIVWDVITGGRP